MMTAGMRTRLRHGAGVSELAVGDGADFVRRELAPWVAGRQIFVLTSAPVWALYGDAYGAALGAAGDDSVLFELPDGEAAKTPAVAGDLWQRMLAAGGRRDSRLVTFGGGTVTDVGGFVAATFMRGLAVSHVPTTVLAQVDAAIGGKSGVNLPAAKNAVGAFHHPDKVVTPTAVLDSLPARELRAGLAEVVKMAVLLDGELLTLLERDLNSLLSDAGDTRWQALIACAQQAKAAVVECDPEEQGERRVLNFGHTLGHAIEAVLGYGVLLHGEAVAHGMRFATRLAAVRGLESDFEHRLDPLIRQLSPRRLPELSVERLLEAVGRDKKAERQGPVWVLPRGVGSWHPVRLREDEIAGELADFLAAANRGC